MQAWMRNFLPALLLGLTAPAVHAAVVTVNFDSLYEYLFVGVNIVGDNGEPTEPGIAGDVYLQSIFFQPVIELNTQSSSVSYDDTLFNLGFTVDSGTSQRGFVQSRNISW